MRTRVITLLLLLNVIVAITTTKYWDPFERIAVIMPFSQGDRGVEGIRLRRSIAACTVVCIEDETSISKMHANTAMRLIAQSGMAAMKAPNAFGNREDMIAIKRLASRWANGPGGTSRIAWLVRGSVWRQACDFIESCPDLAPDVLMVVDPIGPRDPGRPVLKKFYGRLFVVIASLGFESRNREQDFIWKEVSEGGADVHIAYVGGGEALTKWNNLFVVELVRNCARFWDITLSKPVSLRGGVVYGWVSIGAILVRIGFAALVWPWWNAGKRLLLFRRAGVIVAIALLAVGCYLLIPLMSCSTVGFKIARIVVIPKDAAADFDWLLRNHEFKNSHLGWVIDHIMLSRAQRMFFYKELDEQKYREFVISPVISKTRAVSFDWRRELWNNCRPRIERGVDVMRGAGAVVQVLLETVEIGDAISSDSSVRDVWSRGVVDSEGFEQLYVAGLRSIGIASRLGESGRAEVWLGNEWVLAPSPPTIRFMSVGG